MFHLFFFVWTVLNLREDVTMIKQISVIKKTYAILMIISIICTAILGFYRMDTENLLKSVDMVLDYEELVQLANQSEHDVTWWLEKFHSVGFHNVALKERTFENLMNEGAAIKTLMRDEFVQNRDMYGGRLYSKNTVERIVHGDKFDYIAVFDDDNLYDTIKHEISKRYPADFVYFADESRMMVFDGRAEEALYLSDGLLKDEEGKNKRSIKVLADSKLSWLGLGFSADDIRLIKEADMKPLLRPVNFPRFADNMLLNFKNDYTLFDAKPDYIIFQGDSVLGYDLQKDEPEDTYRFMHDENISLGLIESGVQRGHSKQKGINELAQMLDYKAVRVFPIVGYIQKRYKWYGYEGAQEIENTIYRAVTERNIRSVYFRPLREKDNDVVYITDWEPYAEMFHNLEKRLMAHHITIGEVSYMPINVPYPLLMAGVSFGLIAIGMYLLTRYLWIAKKLQWLFLMAGIIGTIALSYIAPNVWAMVLGMLTAILVPSLGAVILCDEINKLFDDANNKEIKGKFSYKQIAIFSYLGLILMMMLGGFALGGILSHSSYLLEIDYFRGVKLSQIIPIMIFTIVFVLEMNTTKEHNRRYQKWQTVFSMVSSSIKVYHVILLGLVGAVGMVYIARTGHETNIQPSNLEMIVRNALEMGLLARPRTKEMFIAFPALYILLRRTSMGKKSGSFVLGLLTMLGLTSVLNTFSHLRTPLYMSSFRTFYSMILGLIIGSMVLVLIVGLEKLFNRYVRYIKEEDDE